MECLVRVEGKARSHVVTAAANGYGVSSGIEDDKGT